ncbi:hypothetical protein BJX70DRAFT_403268 [Aspergillus crustosus]
MLPFRKPRSRAKEGPAFVFIDASDCQISRKDEDTRALIRQQAARSGRKNQRVQAASQVGTEDSRALVRQVMPVAGARDLVLSLQPSFTGYEALRVKYNFDITYLTSLTDVDLGPSASPLLQEQPTLLTCLLQQQSSSFLSYLPSRYGSSQYLDDAMRCLAARAGQMFGFPTRAATMTVLYGKALQSLQRALADGRLSLGPDVHCATRLLALYELISRPEASHWFLHNKGGMKLVEMRGPEHHTSRFDWLLLKSQGPSILVDEILGIRHSIFEAPAWQSLLKHASRAETDPDSSLWWELFAAMCFVPGIISEMRDIFTESLPPSQYFTRTPYPPSLFNLPITPESPNRVRLRGFFLYGLMTICRALATLSVSAADRATPEVEAQAMAAQALLIQTATAELDPVMSWHFEQRNALSQSIVQTRAQWASGMEVGLIELSQFLGQRWLSSISLWICKLEALKT